VWDWKTSLSNYTTLRAGAEAAFFYKGWEIESSIDVNEQLIATAIISGGNNLNGTSAGFSDPSEDYLPVIAPATGTPDGGDAASTTVDAATDDGAAGDGAGAADADGGNAGDDGGAAGDAANESGTTGDGGAAASDAGPQILMTTEEVRAADINTLFAGQQGPTVRITRIRSDIAHTAMTADLILQASSDQTELSNIRQVRRSVNESCSIYDGCNVVGTGTPQEAAAKSKSGGCAAIPGLVTSWSSASGMLAGLLGLAIARARSSRRRSPRTKS
jgi:hypothetical protein